MDKEIKHNPVLNGSTKKVVIGITVMIGIITTISLVGLIALLALELDKGVFSSIISHGALKGTLGGITTLGLGALTRMTNKFMDIRTDQEKDKFKLARYDKKLLKFKEKMKFKTENMKWKHKQEEIMKKPA